MSATPRSDRNVVDVPDDSPRTCVACGKPRREILGVCVCAMLPAVVEFLEGAGHTMASDAVRSAARQLGYTA